MECYTSEFDRNIGRYTIVLSDKLPTITTNLAPFEQVIRNLISNAIKHHDKDEGRIEIGYMDTGSHHEFSVADDGPGIDPSNHDRIFEMFQTLRPRDQVETNGMGLSLVRKIVTQHDGIVSVNSNKDRSGRGCSNAFHLAQNPAHLAAEILMNNAQTRLLVVDDDT